jgi:two-component system, NarL family, response regulator
MFRLHRPDVTLMDLQMPDMNGTEAITRIQSEFPDARIVVLTTYTGDAQVLRALRAGAPAMIGPGAWSVDALLFGRKQIRPLSR